MIPILSIVGERLIAGCLTDHPILCLGTSKPCVRRLGGFDMGHVMNQNTVDQVAGSPESAPYVPPLQLTEG